MNGLTKFEEPNVKFGLSLIYLTQAPDAPNL